MQQTTLAAKGLICLLITVPLHAGGFDDDFRDRTLRLDYFRTGSATEEIFALDEVVSDGPWAGSRTRLLDELNLGEYFFAVFDDATHRMLYSRGFSSIYGEWVTTAEARRRFRTFHESLRFPWPRRTVRVVVEKRDTENHFRPVWSVVIDPNSRFVNPVARTPTGEVWTLLENGPPSAKVDLLILGDGFTETESGAFRAAAERMVAVLFATEPFKRRRQDFNVRALFVPSSSSGVSRPRANEFRRTPFGTRYNIFDSERYVLTLDNRALRDLASAVPYEFVEILVNEAQYGGGGIFNDQATASVGAGFVDYLVVHEFAHHFAGLGDEYYTSDVAYEKPPELPEPWRPNVTALHEAATLKWGDLVDDETPVPTPWPKEAYEERMRGLQERRRGLRAQRVSETVMDEFFVEVKEWSTAFLGSQEYAGRVGAFEGAEYQAKGLYRPELDCIMFSRDDVGFCRVCQRSIERVIDLYSRD